MCNVPLHHYFSTLGVSTSACMDRPELILVDDNARVSAPSRISASKSSLRKVCRWDSTGCLHRLDNEEPSLTVVSPCDTSPSLLKHRKEMLSQDIMAPPTSTLRRCQSELVFHSAWSDGGSTLTPDQPLRRPTRHTLAEKAKQVHDDDDSSVDVKYHCTKSNIMEVATISKRLPPATLCELPYDMDHNNVSPSSYVHDDLDQMVGLDWD